jgi:hypothetical protein
MRLVLATAGLGLAAALLLTVAATPAQALEISWGGTRVVGSGRLASETRPVGDFEAIATRGSIKLLVRQGSREAVEVKADDNVLPLVETRVEDGRQGRTLVIGLKKGYALRSSSDIVVSVDVVKLKVLSSSGSGEIRVEALKTPTLTVDLAGAADAKIGSLQTDELSVSISGSGDVDANGSATRLKISIAGSGDARLSKLQSDEVTVGIAGSGDAAVVANKTLSVSIAGSGDVSYQGNGQIIKSSIAGSGSVQRK